MLVLLLALAVASEAIEVKPMAFLKLNDSKTDDVTGKPVFGNGAATYADYDAKHKYLYVIGTTGDVMNVIDMNDANNPRVVRKHTFDWLTDGYPDAIAHCNYGIRSFLAVSFEKVGTSSKGFVKIFRPLTSPIDDLQVIYDRVVLDGYDPTSMAWTTDCGALVVVQQGRVHKINNAFDDPKPYVDVIVPGISSASRTPVPIDEAALAAAGVRHVLRKCEDDASKTSSAVQDLEPRSITVDRHNVAYIAFPKNNAVARLNLNRVGGQGYVLEYMNVGTKDWKSMTIDGADDSKIDPKNYPIRTFYQPADLQVIEHNNVTYLVTADMGDFMSLSKGAHDCQFNEGTIGRSWIKSEQFSAAVSSTDKAAITAAFNDNSQLGNMRFTKVHSPTDGFDPTTQGFDFVTGYGGRGISILKPGEQTRVYDSGDVFESVFTEPNLDANFKSVFNADVANANTSPSSRKDKMSTTTGPTVRAVASGVIRGTTVIVAANGQVGGLYSYVVDGSGSTPIPVFQGFTRRGNPGQTWTDSYKATDDSVGEPETKDIQWIPLDSPSEAMIAVLSNRAGAVSFYKITLPL